MPPDLGGVAPAVAEQLAAYHDEQSRVEIWPENETAVELFHRVQTQWRVGMSGATGLDYTAVEAVMRLMGLDTPLETLDQIQVMELETLEVFREQRDRD